MRTFHLDRKVDMSMVSGTGRVAEGVEFSDGQCIIHWLTKMHSIGIYENVQTLIDVHGHEGQTVVTWDRKPRVTTAGVFLPECLVCGHSATEHNGQLPLPCTHCGSQEGDGPCMCNGYARL